MANAAPDIETGFLSRVLAHRTLLRIEAGPLGRVIAHQALLQMGTDPLGRLAHQAIVLPSA